MPTTSPASNDNARARPDKPSKDEMMRRGLCFKCLERGHTSKECTKRGSSQNSAHVNRCDARRNSLTPTNTPDRRASDHVVRPKPVDIDSSGDSDNEPIPNQYIDTDEFHELAHVNVNIDNLPVQSALVDGGSNICCIREELIKGLNAPVVHRVYMAGARGGSQLVDVVRLNVRPSTDDDPQIVNIAPPVRVWFAVVPQLNECVLLTPSVVNLLNDIRQYNVVAPVARTDSDINDNTSDVTNDDHYSLADTVLVNDLLASNDDVVNTDQTDICDVESPDKGERTADAETLASEQHNCPSLQPYFQMAAEKKGGFFVDGGLLYHHDTIMGHSVKQLCLPDTRVPVVLEVAHDAPFAGHMAFKTTSHRIKLSFWFPKMNERIRSYCSSCTICQLRAPNRVANRVPITPIPRGDELPFTHLVMDCIGPIIPEGDPTASKPEYNYALVIVDRYSRWPMAYPLRTMTAKAVCDALLQVFMTFSIPKIVSSDCGTNFTSKLTTEFLKRLGCCPRFNTPGHPEASGLVERCNQSLKTMIYKLAQSDPRGWHKLLPFVLWSLRERPSDTTHISPYTLVYGTLPRGPLSVLKESWEGERPLPLNIGKKPEEYLQSLKENLEMARAYADYYANAEMKRYATNYNLRSTDRHYELGDKVAVLSPDSTGAKLYSRWHGPGTIVEVKSPYSYIVELDGRKRHVHANKIKKFNERIEQALVQNCTVVFDRDEEFGSLEPANDDYPTNEPLPSSRIEMKNLDHLSLGEREQLLRLLDDYSDIFSDKPGFCPLIEHKIKLTSDFKPKRMRAYKVPEVLKPEVDKQIRDMLDQGIIVPSTSEMASPVVCVLKGPKGQNGVRLAIDYRHVNRYSAGDCFPTPDIPDVLQKVGSAKYISCFDAKSGYWQIPMEKESQWLTAFVCDAGVFEFRRMPFGLKSASNTFMRCIAQILQPIREFTEPFVDDMAVYSSSWEEHLDHLRRYFDVIRSSGLTLSLRKCSFAQSKVRFVGHVVGSGQIEPDPIKIATIRDIKPPTTKKDVRSLIGFFSYFRAFIPSLAEKIKIITDLTQKHIPNKVPWESVHQTALETLKSDLCNATALHVIDFSKDFGLLVDASSTSIGCCLIQWADDGSENPIAFASMKLSPTQSRWSTIEREAFAVIWALRKFRSWIFLSKIVVFSDHNPLLYLTESAPKSAKLARWALALQDYNIDFRYRAGRKNVAADFLSRMQ